jgi:hypothetical protein
LAGRDGTLTLLFWYQQPPDPGLEVLKGTLAPLEQAYQESVAFLGFDFDLIIVQTKKHIGGEKSYPLVPVKKWVIHYQ